MIASPAEYRRNAIDIKILSYLADGVRLEQIAERMHYSRSTITHRLARMCEHYGAVTNTHLVAIAIREGIIK